MASTTHDIPIPAESAHERTFKPRPYSNPYLAGIGLGLVLLAAFVLMGRGLGASGAFSSLVALGVDTVECGHPVVGDRLYGARRAQTVERPLLHARSLRLPHPRDGSEVVLDSPLPDDMTRFLDRPADTRRDDRGGTAVPPR